MQTDPLFDAAREFMARFTGLHKPKGQTDPWGRWLPDPDELRQCCVRVYRHLPAAPMALYRHCLTFKHVAQLYGVQPRDLKRVAQLMGYRKD